MHIRPLHDWAVIRPSAAEEMTGSGLYIPDTVKEKPHEGVVEAIGPGAFEEEKDYRKKVEKKERRFIPTTIKPGELVLYEQYAGRMYTIEGEERVLVRERDILGILPARPERAREKLRPLQIPAITSSPQSTTSVVKRPLFPLTKKPVISTALVKKSSETVEKKTTRKASAKKKAAKKTAKKSVQKIAKKAIKRPKSGPSKSKKAKKKK